MADLWIPATTYRDRDRSPPWGSASRARPPWRSRPGAWSRSYGPPGCRVRAAAWPRACVWEQPSWQPSWPRACEKPSVVSVLAEIVAAVCVPVIRVGVVQLVLGVRDEVRLTLGETGDLVRTETHLGLVARRRRL